tara:strand:- start:14 stop:397 length:384 start_codon:yes stop_codon:yes gene_type:complete
MSEYIAALPVNGKWSVYENGPDHEYRPNGKRLVLKIPVESVAAYAQYLMTLADDTSKHKDMNVWDFAAKQSKSVKCINVSHNAKDGATDDDGWYGSIAPAALTPPAAAQGCPMPATLQGSNDNDIPF